MKQVIWSIFALCVVLSATAAAAAGLTHQEQKIFVEKGVLVIPEGYTAKISVASGLRYVACMDETAPNTVKILPIKSVLFGEGGIFYAKCIGSGIEIFTPTKALTSL